jgi:hypothetical protein
VRVLKAALYQHLMLTQQAVLDRLLDERTTVVLVDAVDVNSTIDSRLSRFEQ